MALCTVLYSHCGHCFFSGHHWVISDGYWLQSELLLPRTELEPGSQSSSPRPFQWVYRSRVRQYDSDGEHREGMAYMSYHGPQGHIGRCYCRIIQVQDHAIITWYHIPLSLLGREMTGWQRCRSRLSHLGAAIWMCICGQIASVYV